MSEYIKERESSTLEFKSQYTKEALKTVSAYANYGTGTILFGVKDDGEVLLLEDPNKMALTIENAINDSISPTPKYSIQIKGSTGPVELVVYEGKAKPYYYKHLAYRRDDASARPVDATALNRLVLEGENLSFDQVRAQNQNLSFDYLKKEFLEKTDLEDVNLDILRTLGLYSNRDGYNRGAELLADENSYPGVDVVRFGPNISVILDRLHVDHVSILEVFECAMEMFRKYYQYEVVEGARREVHERLPITAFREALANSLIHRLWDVAGDVQVSMFEDRIEITSPGPLPEELSEEEYWNRQVSICRNPVLADVFLKLHIIERFGTGTLRIKEAYEEYLQQPRFEQTEHYLTITLPVIDIPIDLSLDEKAVLGAMSSSMSLNRNEIQALTGMERSKAIRTLNSLIEKGLIEKHGEAKATQYKKV